MTNVEGWLRGGGGGGGGGTHKVYGKNMHRAIKWNNFANIGTRLDFCVIIQLIKRAIIFILNTT